MLTLRRTEEPADGSDRQKTNLFGRSNLSHKYQRFSWVKNGVTKVKYGYARVSTEDQSVGLQVDALTAAGVTVENIYVETISGAAKDRPQFAACIAALEPGDALVVYKIDRLGRSALNVHQTAAELRQRGVSLVVILGVG